MILLENFYLGSAAVAGAALSVVSRRRRNDLGWDAGLTLLLTGLAPTKVLGVLSTGCELTYCGAYGSAGSDRQKWSVQPKNV